MRRKKLKLPPWSRHHEEWCATFKGKPCDATMMIDATTDLAVYVPPQGEKRAADLVPAAFA
jgi:hypothetical protein